MIFIRPSLPMLDFFYFPIYYKIPYMQHLHAIPYNNKCKQNHCKQRRWRAKKEREINGQSWLFQWCFLAAKKTKHLQTNYMNIFCSSDIVNSYYMTRTSLFHPSLRTNDATIIVQCFAFLYFLVVNIKFFLFISRDLLSRDLFSFLCAYFLCYIRASFLFYFNEIYFLEWSRYLFNNTILLGVL